MRLAALIFHLLIPVFGMTQKINDLNPVFENTKSGILKAEGEGYYLSGDLSNKFTDKFINGGFVDSTLKSNILKSLKTENRFGAEQSYGISWYATGTQFFGKPHWGWFGGISNHEYLNALYSKNLFELAFFGNAGFAGDTVQLAPFNLSQWRFQKIRAGAFQKENFSSVSIGFIKAEKLLEMNISDARLYTEDSGLQLSMALSEQSVRSDTANRRRTAFNGWGLCTDIVINLNAGKNKNIRFTDPVRISLENFGFVMWNENTIHRSMDTSFQYSGFEMMNILEGGNSPFTDFELEDTINLSGVKRSSLRLLPFTFSVSKLTDIHSADKWQSFYGFRLRARSNYKPMIFAGVQYRPVQNFTSSIYAAVGGYGGFRTGLRFTGMIAQRFYISAGTGNFTGWFLPQAYGKDLSIGLSVKI